MREGGKHNTNQSHNTKVQSTKILINIIVDTSFDIDLIEKPFKFNQNQLLFKIDLYNGEYNM